jgi:hypothetical protein
VLTSFGDRVGIVDLRGHGAPELVVSLIDQRLER